MIDTTIFRERYKNYTDSQLKVIAKEAYGLPSEIQQILEEELKIRELNDVKIVYKDPTQEHDYITHTVNGIAFEVPLPKESHIIKAMTQEKGSFNLNEHEVSFIDDLIHDAKKYVQTKMLIYTFVGVVISLIPNKFLPSRKTHTSGYDESQNMIEHYGFSLWLLISIIIFIVAVWLMLLEKKYFALRKDRIDLEKQRLSSVVKEKACYPENNHYVIFIEGIGDGKDIRLHLSESQYNEYRVGDNIDVEILKNSKIVI
jgi:hypothetical protein